MNTVDTPTVSGSDRLQSPAADSLHALVERIATTHEHNRSCAPAERRTLKISGGGSKDFYTEPTASSSAHAKPFERLNTAGHSGIVSYEPSELYVTVRGGTPLSELEAVLAEHHQCLAFEPPHFAAAPSDSSSHLATVGGMVAAGLSGPARAVWRHGDEKRGGLRHEPLAGGQFGATGLDCAGELKGFALARR
jgi:FAD binding domain